MYIYTSTQVSLNIFSLYIYRHLCSVFFSFHCDHRKLPCALKPPHTHTHPAVCVVTDLCRAERYIRAFFISKIDEFHFVPIFFSPRIKRLLSLLDFLSHS